MTVTTATDAHPFEAARAAGREPFKVADLSLAESGRKEIRLAEHEMPGLMAVREKYGTEKPLAGLKVMGSLPPRWSSVARRQGARSRSPRVFRSSPGKARRFPNTGGAPSRP